MIAVTVSDHTTLADSVASAVYGHKALQRNVERGGSQIGPNPIKVNPPVRGDQHQPMPSLFRFLTVVAIIVGVVYGAIFALANFVNPKPREMTINVHQDKFLKK